MAERATMACTDCGLPMLYALANDREVDVAESRRASGIDARLVTVGMVATSFSIADRDDPGQLPVAGLDATPQLIAGIARGAL